MRALLFLLGMAAYRRYACDQERRGMGVSHFLCYSSRPTVVAATRLLKALLSQFSSAVFATARVGLSKLR